MLLTKNRTHSLVQFLGRIFGLHNYIFNVDYIIDIGPEGGQGGGTIIAEGEPEVFVKNKLSYTAKYLKKELL